MIDAPTCTVGPSRPIEVPENSPSTVRQQPRRSSSSLRCHAAIALRNTATTGIRKQRPRQIDR
jgi:hypothetical protein